MMERLLAEEAMRETAQVAIAQRMKPGEWMKRQWRQWKGAAAGRQGTRRATPADLAAIGVKVELRG